MVKDSCHVKLVESVYAFPLRRFFCGMSGDSGSFTSEVVGDAGTGKSVLTKQIFAALAQDQALEKPTFWLGRTGETSWDWGIFGEFGLNWDC